MKDNWREHGRIERRKRRMRGDEWEREKDSDITLMTKTVLSINQGYTTHTLFLSLSVCSSFERIHKFRIFHSGTLGHP